jgi:hypothetical protein
LENTTENNEQKPKIKAPRRKRQFGLIDKMKSKMREHHAEKHSETPTDRAVRVTANATVWMAIFTAFLFFTSAATVWILRNQLTEMYEGGIDTHALAQASKRQAAAAQSFSTSAEKIKTSMSDAVDKLDQQVTKLNSGVQQTSRLARDAEVANANALEADRPWIGAVFSISDFSAGKTPVFNVTFQNSGKRPARITLTQTLSINKDFGEDPIYAPYDTTPSTTFVVPGQPVISSWKGKDLLSPISEVLMKQLDAEIVPFRIYAKIEYTDIRTSKKYWTHACWRYLPLHTAMHEGFGNCNEYNDAQ